MMDSKRKSLQNKDQVIRWVDGVGDVLFQPYFGSN